ncbi:MAG: efflux RND transporter permease subunit [Verrucomicrobiae bacterium]
MNSNLSELFVRRPVMTTLLAASAAIFGVIAFLQLPVNDLPVVDFPVINVSVGYPGATPEAMASLIATPLEKQFLQMPGIKLITSTSTQGSTALTLEFNLDKSVDAAATDVQAAITQATGSLPLDLPTPPTFSKFNPNDQPIVYIAVTSETMPAGKLYDFASTQIAQRINTVDGVSKVDIFATKSAIRIKADPSKLATRGLTVKDLAAAVGAGTSYVGSGQLDGTNTTILLQPRGQLESAEDYAGLIIAVRNGSPVYVRDVAEIRDSLQDERQERHFWLRGTKVPAASIVLAVSRQAGANVIQTSSAIMDLLPQIRADLPDSIRLDLLYDRAATIRASVEDVKETLLIAFVLVVAVIFVFLGRATDTLIPAVALPMSLAITFIAMKFLGFSLDNLSLLAITLSIGFLVDDAIVFLENTVRRMEGGENALDATIHGAREISFTILSMTVSLAAVFLPLVFMPGLLGRQLQEFAITIIVSILASGAVSLTLTPLMCARLLGGHRSGKKTRLERASGAILSRVISAYGRSLHFFLRHTWISLVGWLVCLTGTFVLFLAVPKSLLPIGDSGFIRGIFQAQEGSSPVRMRDFQRTVDQVFRADEAVDTQISLTGLASRSSSSQGMVVAFLKPRDKRPPISAVIGRLTKSINATPGIMAFLQANPVLQISTGATATSQGKFAYALTGIDAAAVNRATLDLVSKLAAYPGFLFVNSDLKLNTPSLRIDILRDQASSYGVTSSEILDTIRAAYSQNYAYLIKKPNDQYQVIIEAADDLRDHITDLEKLYVRSENGTLVPLPAVARWTPSLGPQSVNHINQFPSATIFFSLTPGAVIGEAAKFVEKTAAATLPQGVRGSLQGEAKVFKETIASLAVLMIFAVFTMYVILGILYENYFHPLTVLTALPVAAVGGLACLLLFGMEASLYAYVGMFLLIGIVKKNGIMMVDFALQRKAGGLDSRAAVHEACIERFRPIMMTTFAALMGAIPLALGYGEDGESRQPLGVIIVGGLLVSQLITLYVTPALFLVLERFQLALSRRSGSPPAH